MTRRKGKPTNHHQVAAQLRQRPGLWHRVTIYPSQQTAKGRAWAIRTAYRLPMYSPAGAFEAGTQPFGLGTAVIARYVGTAKGGA